MALACAGLTKAMIYDRVPDAEAETCRACFEPIWWRPVGMSVAWVSEGDQAVCPFSDSGVHEMADVN